MNDYSTIASALSELNDCVETTERNLSRTRRARRAAWKTPTFTNSWVNFGASPTYELAGYALDNDGYVHLKGLIKTGATATSAFTLPVGYRPVRDMQVAIAASGGLAYEIKDELVDEIIEKLKAEKFIDDERYVKAYVSDKFRLNKWGKIKMRYYLKAKGLSNDVIEKGFLEIKEEQYKKVLISTLKEKAKTIKSGDKFDKMGQIIRFAQSRGFEPEMIHRYLPEVVK